MKETASSFVLIITLLATLTILSLLWTRNAGYPTVQTRELTRFTEQADEAVRKVVRSRSFVTTAKRCPVIPIETLRPHLKSQSKEDERLLGWFNGLCNGTYIEMGGLDGVRLSNTYVFNKALHWKGLLVEASPSNFEKLEMNRPSELATVHAAVCDDRKIVHYYDAAGGPVRGIWEFAPVSFREMWWTGVTIEQTTPIVCSPLRDIMQQHVPNQHYFDFFSLDIEGAEFMALQSLDFDQVGFGIIFIEADVHNELKNLAVRTFMESKNYLFFGSFGRSYWFVNNEFGSIYKDLLSA